MLILIDLKMKSRRSFTGRFSALGLFPLASVVVFIFLASSASADSTPLAWHNLGNGTGYWVRALTVWNGQLVAGGDSHYVSEWDWSTGGVSLWDGSSWVPLDDGNVYVEPNALTVWDGQLFAGGYRLVEGVGNPSSDWYGVYSWDGSHWNAVGTDYNDVVSALIVWDGGLVAAGDFSSIAGIAANNIAFWNGHAWSPLGQGTNGSIGSLAIWDGKLVASGIFSSAGGVEAQGLAVWDGSQWSAISPYNVNGSTGALTVSDGNLIAVGSYYDEEIRSYASYIVSWNGTNWTLLSPVYYFSIYSLTPWNGGIVVGGWSKFDPWEGRANNIMFWNGSWSNLGEGMDHWVDAFTVWDGKLVAGGRFNYAGQVSANHVAFYDELDISSGHWSPMGSGVNTTCYGVEALTTWNNKLVAGGVFTSAGGVPANYVAAWDGSRWSALGSGTSSPVWALTTWNGKLVAGGDFYSAGGMFVDHVAIWDGSKWSALGSGVNDTVKALTVWNGSLVVAGCFTSASGVNVSNVALWNGLSWSPMGSAMKDCVDSLTVWNGSLVADGTFHTEDSWLYHATVWNDSEWSILGEQGAGPVITVWNGSLVASGSFNVEDPDPYIQARGYAVGIWNGSAWLPLGASPDAKLLVNWDQGGVVTGLQYSPASLTVWNGSLVAGGSSSTWAYPFAGSVDVWNGTNWTALGRHMSSSVMVLNVWNGRLYAGGYFDYADYFTVNNIAYWNVSAQTDTTTCVMQGNSPPCDSVTLSEVVAAINDWSGGGVTLNAVVSLINSWASPESYPPD